MENKSTEPLIPAASEPLTADARACSEQCRRDGWTPFARRLFLQVLSETGRVTLACEYAQLSKQSAYALRARDPRVRGELGRGVRAGAGRSGGCRTSVQPRPGRRPRSARADISGRDPGDRICPRQAVKGPARSRALAGDQSRVSVVPVPVRVRVVVSSTRFTWT